jgi:hypothetical protein
MLWLSIRRVRLCLRSRFREEDELKVESNIERICETAVRSSDTIRLQSWMVL